MNKLLKNGLCILLCVLMLIAAIPTQVFAAEGQTDAADKDEKPSVLTNAQGSTAVGDEWEQAYPYGVFAFSDYGAAASEGDESFTVPVYRLGGTKGRATAFVIYNPAISQLDEDTPGYANALSTDDLELEVEDASPIAQYQLIGKAPDPEAGDYPLIVSKNGDSYIFTLSKTADAYRWQAKSEKGWQDAYDETKQSMTVDAEDYEKYDFRCVYTLGDASYCTSSAHGEKYVKPEPEEQPEIPEDLDLSPAKTYTKLEPDNDDAFKAYVFPVTFAEGEWIKNIRVTPKEDQLAECPEAAALIIQDCEGGCINKSFNSTTITIEDNDPAEPFTLGLTETEIKADKADGSVKVTVRRTGGFQEMVRIGYETVDGTAVAGKDYLASADTMSFAGDIMEMSVDIQLLDDGVKSDKPKAFKLRLKDLKGDSENLCTLKTTEITISLTNSGSANGANLATKLTDDNAIDLVSSYDPAEEGAVDTDPDTATGTQVDDPEPVYAKIKKGSITKSYHYPDTLIFEKTEGQSYWDDTTYDPGGSFTTTDEHVDIPGRWQAETYNPDKTAVMSIPDMTKLYGQLSIYGYLRAGYYDGDWPLRSKIGFGVGNEYKEDIEALPADWWDTGNSTVYNKDYQLTMSSGYDSFIGCFFGGQGWFNKYVGDDYLAKIHIYSMLFTRRVFEKPLALTIHTANDADASGEGNIVTVPDGATALTESSGIYDDLKPQISLVANESGVNSDGKLYVGSKLKVDIGTSAAFTALNSDNSLAIYLTNSAGKQVAQAVPGSDGFYYLTLLWSDMTEADLNDAYTVNVVMSRDQELQLDISPVVPRMDDGITPDMSQAGTAANTFWDNGEDYIEYGYSEKTGTAPYFSSNSVITVKINRSDLSVDSSSGSAIFSPAVQENIQWVNFHRSEDDTIVVNGELYKGNQQIFLTEHDFTLKKPLFYYYNTEYAEVPIKMNATIDHIELYVDSNRNGKIDGSLDDNGFFTLDPDSKDQFLMTIDETGSYSEKDFDRIKNKDGSFSQLYFKIYYTMLPRAMKAKEGQEKDRAQLLPAVITSVTDPEQVFALTDEQKNYRYLISGQNADDSYTSDNHLMYGVEATALQFVDVPLGGDKSPATATTDSDGLVRYSWTPQYEGDLLFPYSDPAPIYIEKSVAGNNIPLASDYDSNGKLSEADIKNINGYLGSCVANTKISLCIFPQKNTVAEMLAGSGGNDDPSDPYGLDSPESSTPIGTNIMPDPGSEKDATMTGSSDGSIATDITDGLSMDYGNKFPKFSCGLCKITVATNGLDTVLGWQVPNEAIKNTVSYNHDNSAASGSSGWKSTNDYKIYNEVIEAYKDTGKLTEAMKKADKTYDKSVQDSTQVFFGFSASASASFAAEWKYDPVQNKSVFKKFTFAFVVSVQGSITWRPVPIVYVCVSAGLSVSFATGFNYKEYNVYEDTPLFNSDTTVEKNRYLVDPNTGKSYFKVDYRSVNIGFQGKIGIELFEDEACTKTVKGAHTGYVQSNSATDMDITLMTNKDYQFKDGKSYYLRISAQDDDATVKTIQQITDRKKEMFSNGVDITISPFVNFAAGIGGGCIKAEICAHFGCSLTFSFGQEKSGKSAIKSFNWGVSLSLNFEFILFSFSFELASISQTYENGAWGPVKWGAFGGALGGDVKSASKRGGVDYDAVMSLPKDTSDTQTIYQTQEKSAPSGLLKSYKPTDVSVPFELSGYLSGSDASRLVDGVVTGYDYQVVSAKNADGKDVNYVLYHISRDSADSTLDQSMLVMSELVMTGEQHGLINPVDPKSATPYIVVDVDDKGNPDEAGDLDFSADTIDDGSKIRVAWVSYDETAEAGTAASTQTLDTAAKNTVVKTSTFTSGKASFAPYEIIDDKDDANADDKNGECVQIPDFSQDAVVFVRSNHMSDQELNDRTALYENYLRTRGYDVNTADTSEDAQARKSFAVSRVATRRAAWTTSGSSSDLCVRIGNSAVSSIAMDDDAVVDSAKIKKIGDTYYIAYTTNEDCYTDNNGQLTEISGEITNMLTIKRLYLRTCTLGKDEKGNDVVEWGMDNKAILLRTLYDYDNNDSVEDGIFTNGSIDQKDNPYFSNLQFLNAELGSALSGKEETFTLRKGVSSEDFLLFDMCGSTYVIRQSSLQSMTGSAIVTDENGMTTTTGTIIPFFTPDITETTNNGASASSGRCDATIGADGDGNLVAVYTSGVPNTNNTALCLSKYDPGLGCWGDKTILAMNYLGVYEDNRKYDRKDEDAAKAFFGVLDKDALEEGANIGGLNEFKFSNPQIALGKETVTDGEGNVTRHATLLILTQGTMQYLKENTDDTTNAQIPYLPADASEVLQDPSAFERSKDIPPGVGIYAIEYGMGTQSIGNASFSMPVEDFSIGATPDINVSFENTGDVAIRGSEDQPITVALKASNSAVSLAEWTITENVIPGQKVTLTGTLNLTETLPAGTALYLKISEDSYYEDQGGTPFVATSQSLIEIEERPELAVRQYNDRNITEFDMVHEDGDSLIDIDFVADNRGTADAKEVYAVFSYDTGAVDQDGKAIFAPLDLTGSEIALEEYTLKGVVGSNPAKGEFLIGNIMVNHGYHVTGKLKVSADHFNEKATDAFVVRIELFSASDKDLSDGSHNEYNQINNIYTAPVEHRTMFTAPINITIPSGAELHIPIECTYTMGYEPPHILAAEFPDLDGETHFSKRVFRYGEFTKGKGSGTLELTAASEGSGYIRVKDVITNCFFDIAYTVTPPADGINVFYEKHGEFAFVNEDGSEYTKTAEDPTWAFQTGIDTWGADKTAPYMNDLARGTIGSSFTFETDAESIDLVMSGTVQVDSTFSGFRSVTVSASGGDGKEEGEYATVTFGNNPYSKLHTVTITVKDGIDDPAQPIKYAYFDRIIAHYNQYELPVPDEDNNGPQIFYDRSFPAKGSIALTKADGKKNSVTMKAFIFDETGIASVSVNGKAASVLKKDDIKYWTVSLNFTGNGICKIAAMDDFGNVSKLRLNVDWFDESAESEVSSTPTVDAALMKQIDGSDDVALTDEVPFTNDDSAYISVSGVTGDGAGTPAFSAKALTITKKDGLICQNVEKDENDTFPTLTSGWYIVKATDPDSNGKCWSAAVVEMKRLNKRQLYITADSKEKTEGRPDPELTYTTRGLWQNDEVTGALAREEGETGGTYAITQGTLNAADDYHILFKSADLTIKHVFAKPTWTLDGNKATAVFTCALCGAEESVATDAVLTDHIPASCTAGETDVYIASVTFNGKAYTATLKAETGEPLGHDFVAGTVVKPTCVSGGYTVYQCSRCDATEHRDLTDPTGVHTYESPTWQWRQVVNLTLSEDTLIDIHPDHYTINSGAPIAADSDQTKYVLSGTIDDSDTGDIGCRLILHDNEDSAATYHLYLKDLLMYGAASNSFITVKGENATVDLTTCGLNYVRSDDYIFASKDPADSHQTTLNITHMGADRTYFIGGEYLFADEGFVVNKDGDYDITYLPSNEKADDFSDVSSHKFWSIGLSGGEENIDPDTPEAAATFTCSVCGETHTCIDRATVYEDVPATCTEAHYTCYRAAVTFNDKEYKDTYLISQIGEPLGHDFVADSVVAPTCTKDGYTIYQCSRCNATEHRDVTAALGHDFGDPTWEWYDGAWDIVAIDVGSYNRIDIHPDYYSLNNGDHIKKRSSYTRYVITGSRNNVEVFLHDGENTQATYNICLHNLSVTNTEKPFIKVSGRGAAVNLSLQGNNTVKCSFTVIIPVLLGGSYVIDTDYSGSDKTPVNTAKMDSGVTTFEVDSLQSSHIFDSKIAFRNIGSYLVNGRDFNIGLALLESQLVFSGGGNDPDPFACPVETLAAFTCSRCQHEEIVKADVTEEYRNGRPYKAATAKFSEKTYTDAKAIPQSETYIIGDVDGSGNVDIFDATRIQRYLVGYTVRPFDIDAAAVTGKTLSILDATAIQRYLAEYHDPYQIGELVNRKTE